MYANCFYKSLRFSLIKFDILSNKQFSFRSGENTKSAIQATCHKILNNLNDRLKKLLIYFDITLAFDCVPNLNYMELEQLF